MIEFAPTPPIDAQAGDAAGSAVAVAEGSLDGFPVVAPLDAPSAEPLDATVGTPAVEAMPGDTGVDVSPGEPVEAQTDPRRFSFKAAALRAIGITACTESDGNWLS